MGRFLNGVLVGIGIGLLVAPMKGDETRRLVNERFEDLRSRLPDNEQLRQAGQQVASGVSQTAQKVKDYAQLAPSQVKTTASNVGDLTKQTATEARYTGQDIESTTQQMASSTRQGGHPSATSPDAVSEEPIIFVDDRDLDEGL